MRSRPMSKLGGHCIECAGLRFQPVGRFHSFSLLLTVFLTVICMPPAHAQVSASIKGSVTDSSGAAVPSASVKTRNIETGAIRSSVADDAGTYLVLALPVGEYEIRIAKPGFRDAVRSGI